MRGLYRFCIHRPRTVIALGVLLCAAVSPGVLRLRLRTDGNALIPPNAPEIAVDHEIRERFDLQDPFVVVVWSKGPEGIYNAHTTALIAKLTEHFQKLDGVDPEQVFSLATEFGDRVFPGTLNFRKLLEPLPTTPEDLAQLRDDLNLYRLYTGMLVSRSGTGATILVGAAPGVDRVAMLGRLQREVAAVAGPEDEISVIGAPVAEALLGTHILQDLGVPDSVLGLRAEASPEAGPLTMHRIRTWIAGHIGLVPIALLVMAAVFYFYFGSIPAVVLPMTEVGACLVVVFAIMGWAGVPIYLTIAVMPIILTAAGVTDEIHVFARYRDRLRENPGVDHKVVLLGTLEEIGRPVIMAGVTTGIGFLAFALSPIAPVQAFGVFTALGLAFCMVWSLTVIPASLSLLNPKQIAGAPSRRAVAGDSLQQRFFVAVARFSVRYRVVVLLLATVVVLLTPLGIRRVVVQDSWIDGFSPESEFRSATHRFNEQFDGGHLLLVEVNTGPERIAGELPGASLDGMWTVLPSDVVVGPKSLIDWRLRLFRTDVPVPTDPEELRRHAINNSWTTWVTQAELEGGRIRLKGIPSHGIAKYALRLGDADKVRFELTPSRLMQPAVMREVDALEAFLERHGALAVGGVVGTADYVETVHFLRRGRKDEHRQIPKGVEEVDWLWREYARMRGLPRIRQLVDEDFSRSVITVFLRDANFVDTARLMSDIRNYERERLKPQGISLSFAGDVAVSQSLIAAIVGTQVISVGAALAGDFLVTVLLGRSVVFGVLCVIPSILAVLANFAIMGWLGMPLGVATSMFSSMTLGMGVDYAIHFLQNYRSHLAAGSVGAAAGVSPDRVSAVLGAARTTGPAICGNTLAVTLGFGVLLLSQVPANARLGGLLALSLFNCLVATLILLPAVLGRRNRAATSALS